MKRLLALAVLVACGDDPDELRVQIDTGVIHGRLDGNARAFLGIPYAAPPVGELRWKPPQPALPLSGVFDAIETGVQCPQTFSLSGPGGSEDCLFVNVWAPRGESGAPVVVWLHGGAFIFGSGGDSYYDGAFLAETYKIVVVTVNYRLGALGFFAHPALTAEDPAYPSSGNYGLDDQHAALEWVQRNISAFGGDPAKVTLFGESAGGFSTCAHYVSPRSAGLFRAAIAESGLCASSVREPTLAEAEATGAMIATELGCVGTGAAACLRAKTADELLAATDVPLPADQLPGGPFYTGGGNALSTLPNVDGFSLPTTLRDAFAAGAFEPRPLIVGTVHDEGTLFHSVFFAKEVADETEYRAALERRFGTANVDAIIARYPVASFATANRALAEVTGDAFFACPARRTARGAAAAGAPVYYYSFDHALEQPFLADLGVFHSSEIPFLFESDPRFPLGRVGSAQDVADTIQGYWVRFAETMDPNGDGATSWPTYDGDSHLSIDTTSVAGTGLRAAACDFWDTLAIP